MTERRVEGAHLVGSAPVASAHEIFELGVGHLGDHLGRIGDGEIGERGSWIRWQYPRLGASPQLRPAVPDEGYAGRGVIEQFELIDPGTEAAGIELTAPGYADAALASYEVFAELKAAGRIPEPIRFMVGLPTPLSVITLYVAPGSRTTMLGAYTSALLADLDRILDEIPHDQLSIQWEICIEFGVLEGIWTLLDGSDRGEASKAAIADHVVPLGRRVPQGVELGYHLCYGDAGHRHFIEPTDTEHLAWMAGSLLAGAERPVDWIHLPVPRDRDDPGYFAAIGELALPDETELYLGLVHQTGGIEGTRRRIETASGVVTRFGVATECGLGRRSLADVPDLLDQHAAMADPVR